MRLVIFVAFVLAGCATAPRAPETLVMAHRGIHQEYDRANLGREDCTATRIAPPTHAFLENTIPSMRATVAYGADIIEMDIHPTTDGDFAVFHDWGIECRTEGRGVTRQQSMAYLRTLDAGYGYTADGGRTFPLRGAGVGLIPNLQDALAAVPDTRVLLNFKSRDANEGRLLAAYLARLSVGPERVLVYGDAAPVNAFLAAATGFRGFSRQSALGCFQSLATGQRTEIPEVCRNTIVMMPLSHRHLIEGWNEDFMERMAAVNSMVFVIAGLTDGNVTGVNDPALLSQAPAGAGIWTDRIEIIGPAVHRRAH